MLVSCVWLSLGLVFGFGSFTGNMYGWYNDTPNDLPVGLPSGPLKEEVYNITMVSKFLLWITILISNAFLGVGITIGSFAAFLCWHLVPELYTEAVANATEKLRSEIRKEVEHELSSLNNGSKSKSS